MVYPYPLPPVTAFEAEPIESWIAVFALPVAGGFRLRPTSLRGLSLHTMNRAASSIPRMWWSLPSLLPTPDHQQEGARRAPMANVPSSGFQHPVQVAAAVVRVLIWPARFRCPRVSSRRGRGTRHTRLNRMVVSSEYSEIDLDADVDAKAVPLDDIVDPHLLWYGLVDPPGHITKKIIRRTTCFPRSACYKLMSTSNLIGVR